MKGLERKRVPSKISPLAEISKVNKYDKYLNVRNCVMSSPLYNI